MTLKTIPRDKFESYFLEMVCYARPNERSRRDKWQGADHVFFFESKKNTSEIAEIEKWLEDTKIKHLICHSNVFTFIEIPSEADATLFWIRFKT